MKERFKVLIRRRKEAMGRKRLSTRPPVIQHPKGLERDYTALLRRFNEEVSKEIRDLLIARLEQLSIEAGRNKPERLDAWVDDVQEIIETLRINSQKKAEAVIEKAPEVAAATSAYNLRQINAVTNRVLGVDVIGMEPWLDEELKSFAKENAALIKSLPDQELTQIEGIVQRGLRIGTRPEEIAKEIRGRFEVTKSRAELIAQDQVSKLNGQLTKLRQQNLGVSMYVWRTSMDERVRRDHRTMEGLLCRWDNPSVYSDDGGTSWKQRSGNMVQLHPGQDYRCRCYGEPVLKEFLDI